jgi:ABC-2 type transport system ATP-binding protein
MTGAGSAGDSGLAPQPDPGEQMTSIEVRGLTKRYGDLVAVDDLHFVAEPGRVTGFLGPNGAGKTTTLRMLLGLVAPSAGAATFGGAPYRDLPAPHRQVGAVLDAVGFHPGRRGRDHLRVLATAGGLPADRVDTVLDQVGLTDAGQRRVKGYSLGMRQRLALASALLGDPRVLVLDEPANGLDPEGVYWLRRFLRSFAAAGGTVLVSSHLLAEVAHGADEVVILAHGRLVVQSSLAELARRGTPGVRVRTPRPEALQTALTAQGIVAELPDHETLLALDTTTEAVGLAAAAAGLVIYEMTSRDFDLEEAFLELTGSEGAIR